MAFFLVRLSGASIFDAYLCTWQRTWCPSHPQAQVRRRESPDTRRKRLWSFPMAHGRRAGRHVCSSIAFLALIAWGGVCFLPSLHQQQFEEIDNEEQEVAFNRTNKPANEENPAQRLKWFLTNPTASCKKLRRLGGRSCLGAYDGAKVRKDSLLMTTGSRLVAFRNDYRFISSLAVLRLIIQFNQWNQ